MSGKFSKFNFAELVAIAIGSVLLSLLPSTAVCAEAVVNADSTTVEPTSNVVRSEVGNGETEELWENIWQILSRSLPRFTTTEIPLPNIPEMPAIFTPGLGNHHFNHTSVF